jgi:hypothetical protein
MQTIKQLITAAGGFSAGLQGNVLLVQSCDTSSTLSVTLTDAQGNQQTVTAIGAGAKLKPSVPFVKVDIKTTTDANVQFIVTNGDIDVQLTSIGSNITNTAGNPVPVAIISEPGAPFQVSAPAGAPVNVAVQGTVTVSGATMTATNVGLIPAGTAITEVGSTAVTSGVAAHVLTAAARKRAIFYNAGTGRIALGGAAGLTFAAAAIILQPGDAWRETDAPQLDWYAISDTGSTVNIQTVN